MAPKTEVIEQLRARIAAQEEINSPPAIDAYEMYMADDEESNPVERLRFFLSLALKGQDWIDVEKFIDDVSNHIAKAEQRVAEACSAYMLNKNYNSLEFDRKYSAKEFCAGQKSTVEFLAKMIRSGEWRKFVERRSFGL